MTALVTAAPATATIAETLARFTTRLRIEDVPDDVTQLARSCLLYGLGIALCGTGERTAAIGARAARSMDGGAPGTATILLDGRRAGLPNAIMANTALFHARAQEDTCGTAHLGAVMIPLMLGLVETKAAALDNFLPALIAGYEVGGQLEAALAADTLAAGFRASALYGLIGATAAACRLLALDTATTRVALAHAVAFNGGNTQTIAEGSDEWRFQLGMAGQAALSAVELAMAGSSGAREAFEGKFGFARAFAKRPLEAAALGALGKDWIMRRVMFKPFPVCAHNQSAVAGAIAMRSRLTGLQAERIEVHVNPYMVPGMQLAGPFSRSSETLLSTPFCVASALVRGRVEIADLAVFDDRAVQDLTARITVVPDPAIGYPASEILYFPKQGEVVRHAERVTAKDYTYDLAQTLAQLRRMGADLGIPPQALAGLHAFVMGLPSGHIGSVAEAFAAGAGKAPAAAASSAAAALDAGKWRATS